MNLLGDWLDLESEVINSFLVFTKEQRSARDGFISHC